MQTDLPPRRLSHLSLFSGYCGFDLALKLVGDYRTIGYVEWEPYCQEIIKARIRDGIFDDAPIFSDIKEFNGTPYRGKTNLITAGFP